MPLDTQLDFVRVGLRSEKEIAGTILLGMKHKLWSAVLFAMPLIQTVFAAPITGSIGFTGTFVQNGGTHGDLTTAQSASISLPPTINVTQGAFNGAGNPTFATPVGINANLSSLIGAQLWTSVVSGVTIAFTVTSAAQIYSAPSTIVIHGNGVITDGNPTNNTPGNWQIGFGVSGQIFTWQSTAASATPPTATTGFASNVATNSATISGSVNPQQWQTTACFQWGTDTNYAAASSVWIVTNAVSTTNLTLTLTGLVANAVYHFRMAAYNAVGTNYGADEIFSTAWPPRFQTTIRSGTALSFTWNSLTGRTYQVQFNQDLTQTNWTNLGNLINTTNSTATATDSITNSQRFYRVVAQ